MIPFRTPEAALKWEVALLTPLEPGFVLQVPVVGLVVVVGPEGPVALARI